MSLHVTKEEQAVFKRFLEVNKLVGQIAPSFTTNTRTKQVLGLLVSVDFIVAEYNEACGGILTKEQAYSLIRKLGIDPLGQAAKPYGSMSSTAHRVLETAKP